MAEALAHRLAERTLALVDIPSESRSEETALAYVRDAMPGRPVYDEDTVLLYEPAASGRPRVLLAGHFDTVPSQGNLPGRIEAGAVVGLGATDMKGGVAVMIELAREQLEGALDLSFLFFGREELSADESPLPRLFTERALAADLVVVLEPTDNAIHVGCLGNVNARLVFTGESAHSARPWLGVNAIDRAVAGLASVTGVEPLPVEIEGLVFTEVVSVTRIAGGIADNVIPDRVECGLNYRYAPNRTPHEAEERLRSLARGDGELEVVSNSPPARVAVSSPLVQRLRAAGELDVLPKQAWTPVAQFAAEGFDAVNFGPGATRYAHKRDEQVEIAELGRTFETLRRFVTDSV